MNQRRTRFVALLFLILVCCKITALHIQYTTTHFYILRLHLLKFVQVLYFLVLLSNHGVGGGVVACLQQKPPLHPKNRAYSNEEQTATFCCVRYPFGLQFRKDFLRNELEVEIWSTLKEQNNTKLLTPKTVRVNQTSNSSSSKYPYLLLEQKRDLWFEN